MATLEEYEAAIVAAIANGLEGESVDGCNLLIDRFPELAERAQAQIDAFWRDRDAEADK